MTQHSHMNNSCIFCKIVERTHAAHILYEDGHFVSFLDKRPVFPGHTLIIPKIHIGCFDDLPINAMQDFLTLAQNHSLALQQCIPCEGTFLAMNNRVSQSVPHLHMHIIPRKFKDGLKGFFWPRKEYQTLEEMNEIAEKIRTSLKKMKRK